MANFLQITPFMHVADVEATTRFFADILGFRTLYRQPGYAYIEREGCGIRIMEAGEGNPLIAGNRRFRYYVDVRDVDGLYAELKPRLDTLPKEDVHGPADKPYGQRELLVKVPDGDLIAFGQGIFTPEGAQVTPGGQDAPHVSKM
ncbi:bleomycin resistance protein [Lysobacter sp. 2RAF19]